MSGVRLTQQPRCEHRRERNFEVVRVAGQGKPHHYLKCSLCGMTAKNAAKPRYLIRWDAELLRQRREELRDRKARKQKAGNKALRKERKVK